MMMMTMRVPRPIVTLRFMDVSFAGTLPKQSCGRAVPRGVPQSRTATPFSSAGLDPVSSLSNQILASRSPPDQNPR